MARVALLCTLLAVSGGAEVRRHWDCRLLHGRAAGRLPRASFRLAAGCSRVAACGLARTRAAPRRALTRTRLHAPLRRRAQALSSAPRRALLQGETSTEASPATVGGACVPRRCPAAPRPGQLQRRPRRSPHSFKRGVRARS
jgi:hypothetical protein